MDIQRQQQNERRVICAIERGYGNSDSDVGKLRAFFEVSSPNEVTPINSTKMFCETEQVFVTGKFSELKEKFGNKLFEVYCIPSFEHRDGDCRYVTRLGSCSDIKGLSCCQVFDHPLPSVTEPEVVLTSEPQTKSILFRDKDFIYGPFEYTNNTETSEGNKRYQVKAITTPINTTTPSFHIGKVSSPQYISSLYDKIHQPVLLGNIKRCFDSAELIDFISDDQIISTYGTKIAKNSEIRSFNKGTITQIRKSFASSIEQRRFPQRFQRLFEALEKSNSWEGNRKELIDSFLKTDSGKQIVDNYIHLNPDDLFKGERQSYLEQLDKEYEDKHNEIENLRSRKEEIESEIRKLQREREQVELNAVQNSDSNEALEVLTQKHKAQFDTEIQDKKKELDDLQSEIAGLKSKYRKFTKMEAIEDEIKGLDRDKDRAKERLKDMEEQVVEVQKKLKESNESLTARLLKLKPDVDALSGIAPRKKRESVSYNIQTLSTKLDNLDDFREELIDRTLDRLNKLGRKTDYNTVTNILTTLAQSQFTLFSGRPGTGKTSLAKMLGTSLGLQNRLLNIPVARGWTSSKDILGFYNALSCSFNPAATGLYELLTQLHKESKDSINGAPAICLLDEFNLSQPEHYFSPFLEMSDPESKRTIATGDQEAPYLEVPHYLRFLGTINNDESVQPLTPRMLDRAAIISFDEIEPDYDLSLGTPVSLDDSDIIPISGKAFIEAFAPKSLVLPQEIELTLKEIVDTLRDDKAEFGSAVNVSFRKVKAIRAYHNVTSSMYIDNRFVALDYAVSQHIIPLLNGYGKNFGTRLEQLKSCIPDEMEISHKMLHKIIRNGDQNMFTYGFNL
ncbi:AAA family ATPase [Paraphotobacterium marinum]|uniref:AAA family ATPase n=2 Tax=Paraphotobacterium marinum TaxID=1755811 RepID=UPI0011AB3548|nr:AAA family ATPase [Paraphotobacterium marinum]